jgi:PX domain
MIRIRGFSRGEEPVYFDVESRYVDTRQHLIDEGNSSRRPVESRENMFMSQPVMPNVMEGFSSSPTVVKRRFSEFVELQKALQQHLIDCGMASKIDVPKLPPKILGAGFRSLVGGSKERELEKRMRGLEIFLQEVLQIEDVASTDVFLAFLGVKEAPGAITPSPSDPPLGEDSTTADASGNSPGSSFDSLQLPGPQDPTPEGGEAPPSPSKRMLTTRSLSSFMGIGRDAGTTELNEAKRRIGELEEEVRMHEANRAALEESLEKAKRALEEKDALIHREKQMRLSALEREESRGGGEPTKSGSRSVKSMFGTDSMRPKTNGPRPSIAANAPFSDIADLERQLQEFQLRAEDLEAQAASDVTIKNFLEAECDRLQRHSELRIKSLERELSVALDENRDAREALEVFGGATTGSGSGGAGQPPTSPAKGGNKSTSVAANFHRRESERLRAELGALQQVRFCIFRFFFLSLSLTHTVLFILVFF